MEINVKKVRIFLEPGPKYLKIVEKEHESGEFPDWLSKNYVGDWIETGEILPCRFDGSWESEVDIFKRLKLLFEEIDCRKVWIMNIEDDLTMGEKSNMIQRLKETIEFEVPRRYKEEDWKRITKRLWTGYLNKYRIDSETFRFREENAIRERLEEIREKVKSLEEEEIRIHNQITILPEYLIPALNSSKKLRRIEAEFLMISAFSTIGRNSKEECFDLLKSTLETDIFAYEWFWKNPYIPNKLYKKIYPEDVLRWIIRDGDSLKKSYNPRNDNSINEKRIFDFVSRDRKLKDLDIRCLYGYLANIHEKFMKTAESRGEIFILSDVFESLDYVEITVERKKIMQLTVFEEEIEQEDLKEEIVRQVEVFHKAFKPYRELYMKEMGENKKISDNAVDNEKGINESVKYVLKRIKSRAASGGIPRKTIKEIIETRKKSAMIDSAVGSSEQFSFRTTSSKVSKEESVNDSVDYNLVGFSIAFDKFCEECLIFRPKDRDYRILQKEVLAKWKEWGNKNYKNFVSKESLFYGAIKPRLDPKKPKGQVFVNAEWIFGKDGKTIP
jgi:hypothetical protein